MAKFEETLAEYKKEWLLANGADKDVWQQMAFAYLRGVKEARGFSIDEYDKLQREVNNW